jgi:hypothetical protein
VTAIVSGSIDHARGGGVLTARDHQDLGCSVCQLGVVGAAHHFHTQNPEASERRVADDTSAQGISWPTIILATMATSRASSRSDSYTTSWLAPMVQRSTTSRLTVIRAP